MQTYLEHSRTFMVDLLCKNPHVRLGPKYVSGIGFTVKNLYRMSILSDIVKVDFKNLSLPSWINKKHVGLTKEEYVICSPIFCCCW